MEDISIKKTIVVILHGYGMGSENYASLEDMISITYPEAEIVVPEMPLSIFSCADPNKIINDRLLEIDNIWKSLNKDQQNSLKIMLIGHSTGALLARKLYVAACGQNDDAMMEKEIAANEPRDWAKNVERVILFAGINKGWTLNPHLSLKKAIVYGLAISIGNIMSLFGFHPVAFKTRKGASFITQLRIQSLSMYRHAQTKKIGKALIIQLLGTQDDIVSPEDNIDLVTGNKFVYLEIPFSDHINVIDMTGKNGNKRKDILLKALTYYESDLRKIEVVTSDTMSFQQDEKVTDVVFVIHGIRDTGYWTQKIAGRVKNIGDKVEGRKYATETSTYGYFPMLSFILYPFRQAKVQWLMDQYTENLAQYPNATFSFIGHSNGTYLLAKALQEYPACKFKNIVLAGSVVKQTYNWQALIDQKRIKSIFNFVATNDLVVGIFPKTFQTLGIQDLGSGGFDGFSCLNDSAQFKCIDGGHGAAIKENIWDELAHITVYGQLSGSKILARKERSNKIKFLAFISPFIFLAGLLLIIGGAASILILVNDPTWKLFFLSCYIFLIYKILTWV